MFKVFTKSQAGFSLVQALILAGIVATMAYIGTLLMSEQKLAVRGVEQRTNTERLHSMIYSILQNKDHCTETFSRNNIRPSVTTIASSVSYPFSVIWPMNSTAAVFSVKAGANYTATEKYMSNTVGISRMILETPADNFNSNSTLSITYDRLGQGYAGKSDTRNIAIRVQRTPTGLFLSCYAVEEAVNQDLIRQFCEGLGDAEPLFEWDQTTNSCKIRDKLCPLGQVFAGIDPNGFKRCNAIHLWSNLADFLDTSKANPCWPGYANHVRFDQVPNNKVQVICQSGTPPATGCSSHCDCGTNEMCTDGGQCVATVEPCVDGSTANGGACLVQCSGGVWNCTVQSMTAYCGSTPPASCATHCDCSPGQTCAQLTVGGTQCVSATSGSACAGGQRAKTSSSTCDAVCTSGTWPNMSLLTASCSAPYFSPTTCSGGGSGSGGSCTLPWGGTIANGASVTAYKLSSPVCPNGACQSETRTCTDGVLSGTATAQNCTPITCADCSQYNSPFDETSGCVEDIVEYHGWSESPSYPGCECRVMRGTFYAYCDPYAPDGNVYATECRSL